MVKVSCNGCFDGLHPGHLFLLGFCRAQGDYLCAGINSDEYVRGKKRDDAFSAEDRAKGLMATGIVDEVVIFDGPDRCRFIEEVGPDVHCIGEEYKGRAPEERLLREMDVEIVYVPRVGDWSSTSQRSGVDVNLVPTTDLLDALLSRHEHAVFAGVQTGYGQPDQDLCRRRWKGNSHTCVGLAFDVQCSIMSRYSEESRAKEDEE